MLVLGIESSCDETAVALLESCADSPQPRVLSSVISTQIPLHRMYGGVIPELASRNHSTNLPVVLREALEKAGRSIHEVDVFASTAGPGLVAALLVGNTAAKALALAAVQLFEAPEVLAEAKKEHLAKTGGIYEPAMPADVMPHL